jgi:UDP-4-keto-D-QuiNAc 4-reductase
VTEVAVTGANGFIGRHLTEELEASGFGVRGLVRSSTGIPQGFVTVDYDDPPSIQRGLEGCDMVVHLLGLAHQGTNGRAALEQVNVGYTRATAAAAATIGVRRFVFLSSVKAVGNGSDTPYSEETEPHPADAYGRSKLGAELALRAFAQPSGMDHVILRPPLVYGAGVKGNLQKLITAVEHGWPVPLPAHTRNIRSLVCVTNLASAIVATLSAVEPIDGTYFVADGSDFSTSDLVRLLGRVAGKRVHLLPIPERTLRGLARLAHADRTTDRLLGSLSVDASRFAEHFSWIPRISPEEGMTDAVRGYRRSH